MELFNTHSASRHCCGPPSAKPREAYVVDVDPVRQVAAFRPIEATQMSKRTASTRSSILHFEFVLKAPNVGPRDDVSDVELR